jgi:competence protein ComEC
MIANHKGEVPVVVLILPFLAGITCGLYFLSTVSVFIIAPLILLSAIFISLNLVYTRLKVYKVRWLGGMLLSLILFLLGWWVTIRHSQLNNADHFSKKPAQYLVAVISGEPKQKNELVRFAADIKQTMNKGKMEKSSGTLLITIKDEIAKNLFYGEELLVPATYTTVDPPFNPAEFNYKRYLANKNVYHQLFLYPKQYAVVKSGQGNPVIAYALQLRQNLVKKLKVNITDTTAAAVAATLILGYKADLSNDVLQAYSKTGTIHILSVSGGHVAIIYLLLGWALGFLNGYKQGRLLKAILIITLIWGYALLTGFSPAVCRAALMISLIIAGKTYSRYINTLNILAVSAFALLLYDPFLLTDVGFQLSYLAVAGLIVFQPLVYQWFSFKNKVANKLWLLCSVSIAAQAITFPLSAYYFHQLPVYFLLSNLLIIIPVAIIMYSGLLLLMLPQLPGISKTLGYVLEHCILLMNKSLAYIEHTPYAGISKIWITKFEYLLLYAIILLVFYFMYDRKVRFIRWALICTLLFCISISFKKLQADNTKSVTFLNLRKHSGIVFKNGSAGAVLTDLTDTDNNFQYAVQPMLDSSRISNYTIRPFNSSINLPYLIKRQNLVQFLNKRLLLLNDGAQVQSIPQGLIVHYFYITGDTHINDNILIDNRKSTVILDGSNTDNYITAFKLKTHNKPVNYRVLKRNKSATVVSN